MRVERQDSKLPLGWSHRGMKSRIVPTTQILNPNTTLRSQALALTILLILSKATHACNSKDLGMQSEGTVNTHPHTAHSSTQLTRCTQRWRGEVGIHLGDPTLTLTLIVILTASNETESKP